MKNAPTALKAEKQKNTPEGSKGLFIRARTVNTSNKTTAQRVRRQTPNPISVHVSAEYTHANGPVVLA